MKYVGAVVLALVSVFLIVMGCASTPKSATPQAKWFNNMHRLSAAHLRLMPLVGNGKAFADPSRRTQIRDELREMVETTNDIVADNKAPNADPIIQFTASRLNAEVKQAYASFEMGDLQWARFSASRTSSYCISCHTRADRGVKDFNMSWTADLSALTSQQRVEFLLANRRYHSALEEAKGLASDADLARRDPRGWILGIERTLAMVVRVNNDPGQAEVLVKAVLSNKSAPFYLRGDASAWLRDIRDWKSDPNPTRGRDAFRVAARMVDRAQKLGSRNPSQLIQFLRASRIIHELLENTKSPKYAQTLLYAGMVSDSLRDLNLGFLDQYYYESCITQEPHSELAEDCYSRLELSVREANPLLEIDPMGYWDLNSRLEDFRKLAEVKDVMNDPRWQRRFWEEDFKNDRQ
jgi:hypothetical protein